MTNSTRIIEVITGISEEPTQIDEQDFSGRHPDQLVVKNSKGSYLFTLILSLVLSIILLISLNGEPIAFYLFLLLPITLAFFAFKGIRDQKPKLIIDRIGIQTPEFQYTWDEITSTGIRVELNRSTLLVISTEKEKKYVDLDLLDISPRYLGHQIELIKRQQQAAR